MLIEDKIEIMGTYDPVSQVSFLKSVNGVNHTNGLVRTKIKILNIEKEVEIYIVEREDFEDFIIGLDLIPTFKLRLNENLEVSQKIEKEIEKSKRTKSGIKSEATSCSVNFNEHVETDEFRTEIEHLDGDKKVR